MLVLDIREKPAKGLWALLSFQHVFAMFGATVLVPILTGLSISVALFASGIGTLIYIACTKAKVPVYLGSSFAYIAAISIATQQFGVESAFVGLMVVGIIYMIVSLIIRFVGKNWLDKLLPPVVIGPMIAIIGIGLAPVATGQAGINPGHPDLGQLASDPKNVIVAAITFLATTFIATKAKGFFKIVPILGGIIIGYMVSLFMGMVDFSPFTEASFFALPNFNFIGSYSFDWRAVAMFAPIAFVTIAEHIGDHKVLGSITKRNFIEDPGLDKTLLGDGLATFVSAALGGPANTTYGENTGVVGMTKVASVYVTGGAAIIAITLSFIGKFTALISTIPTPVMGGILILLFGLIAGNGLKVMIESKVDLSKTRNIVIVASMLVIGLGGASFSINDAASLTGMSLAAVVGIVLNLLLKEE
ncbi:solute carrier family 23 protein [Mycoplasmatota bacterium zrk1]